MTASASSRIEPPPRETDKRRRGLGARASGGRPKRLTQCLGLIAVTVTLACASPGQAQAGPETQNTIGNEKLRSGPTSTAEGTTIHVASPLVIVPREPQTDDTSLHNSAESLILRQSDFRD